MKLSKVLKRLFCVLFIFIFIFNSYSSFRKEKANAVVGEILIIAYPIAEWICSALGISLVGSGGVYFLDQVAQFISPYLADHIMDDPSNPNSVLCDFAELCDANPDFVQNFFDFVGTLSGASRFVDAPNLKVKIGDTVKLSFSAPMSSGILVRAGVSNHWYTIFCSTKPRLGSKSEYNGVLSSESDVRNYARSGSYEVKPGLIGGVTLDSSGSGYTCAFNDDFSVAGRSSSICLTGVIIGIVDVTIKTSYNSSQDSVEDVNYNFSGQSICVDLPTAPTESVDDYSFLESKELSIPKDIGVDLAGSVSADIPLQNRWADVWDDVLSPDIAKNPDNVLTKDSDISKEIDWTKENVKENEKEEVDENGIPKSAKSNSLDFSPLYIATTQFPFCIPWDLMKAVKMFYAPGKCPNFTLPGFEVSGIKIDGFTTDFENQVPYFSTFVKIEKFFLSALFLIFLITQTRRIINS